MVDEQLIRQLLSRRDPQGYYVVPVSREFAERLGSLCDVLAEEAGDVVVLRTRSRRLAKLIAEKALREGALRLP